MVHKHVYSARELMFTVYKYKMVGEKINLQYEKI